MRRKPNAGERRRDLCDAAIELLANGLARLEKAKQLEGYLHAVIAGVAAEHPRIRRAGHRRVTRA